MTTPTHNPYQLQTLLSRRGFLGISGLGAAAALGVSVETATAVPHSRRPVAGWWVEDSKHGLRVSPSPRPRLQLRAERGSLPGQDQADRSDQGQGRRLQPPRRGS